MGVTGREAFGLRGPELAVRDTATGGEKIAEAGLLAELFVNGFLAFAFDCAASQPAKSGSPPSSKGTGTDSSTGREVALGLATASKKVSSSPLSSW
jgi:hypothetical protein